MALFLTLAGRLVHLQVFLAPALRARAEAQWRRESVISPKRGSIYDRNGETLAVSATAYIASVSPRQVRDAARFADLLAPVLDMDAETIAARAGNRAKGGVILKRQIPRERAIQIRQMMAAHDAAGSHALDGLYLEEDARRYYPLGSSACQLIGLTTIDGVGQSGLEQRLDEALAGTPGRVLDDVDGKGRAMADGERVYEAAVNGGDVTLTLDSNIQMIVEQAAREAMTVNGAKAVRVLAMEPSTGAILAMCVKPDFDLNDPPRDDVEALTARMRNRLVSDVYEPGSTFKVLTTACALEAKVTSVGEGFYCSGSYAVDGGRIRCWGNPHGAETMARGLENSCNPVFAELGLRLGVERFYDFLTAFGLGSKTGVDIAGEVSGILIPRASCRRGDIARIGFGQSVALTPIQLLTAACACVNGGNLMKPYVVDSIVSETGETTYRGTPTVVGHPISAETSAVMRDLLEGVVDRGGGKNARLAQYRVGGKTGTAQFYVDGVVSSDTHIGSFLGFAPMDDPKLAVLVIVDEATVRPDYGSVTAAPFARQIIERALPHLGVAPDDPLAAPAKEVEIPDVVGSSPKAALAALRAAGLHGILDGAGASVVGQLPAAGARMPEQSQVMLYVEGATPVADLIEVPDVAGLSVVEANRLLLSYDLRMRMNGSGIATSQTPEAGDYATPTSVVTVRFETPG